MRSPDAQAELVQVKSELVGLVAELKAAYRLVNDSKLTHTSATRIAQILFKAIGQVQDMLSPKWPEPTTDEPDLETLESWMFEDGGCEATDGCWVEPDGVCQHGHPSWFLRLGLI